MERTVNLIITVFCIITILTFVMYNLTGSFYNTNDYYFHLYKTQNNCYTQMYDLKACNNYPPLYHFIGSIFVFDEGSFLAFNYSLFILIMPLLLFYITKHYYSVLIYFTSSFLYITLSSAIYAQAFLTFILILMLRNKKIEYLDAVLLGLGVLIHSKALFILLPIFIYKFIKFPNISNWAVYLIPAGLNISSLIRLTPPVLYGFFNKLETGQLLVILYYFVASLIINDFRPILFIPILLALWLTDKIKNYTLGKPDKAIFFLWGFVQIFLWLYDTYNTNLLG